MGYNPKYSALSTYVCELVACYGTLAYIGSRNLNAGQIAVFGGSKIEVRADVVHTDIEVSDFTLHYSTLASFFIDMQISHPEALECAYEGMEFARHTAKSVWNQSQSFEDNAHDYLNAFKQKIGYFA